MITRIHVIPVNDIKSHIDNIKCECIPSIETIYNSEIVVHNAYDKREYEEVFDPNIIFKN